MQILGSKSSRSNSSVTGGLGRGVELWLVTVEILAVDRWYVPVKFFLSVPWLLCPGIGNSGNAICCRAVARCCTGAGSFEDSRESCTAENWIPESETKSLPVRCLLSYPFAERSHVKPYSLISRCIGWLIHCSILCQEDTMISLRWIWGVLITKTVYLCKLIENAVVLSLERLAIVPRSGFNQKKQRICWSRTIKKTKRSQKLFDVDKSYIEWTSEKFWTTQFWVLQEDWEITSEERQWREGAVLSQITNWNYGGKLGFSGNYCAVLISHTKG